MAEPRELSPDECWTLLGDHGTGRLAVQDVDEGVDIFPIDYLVTDRRLYFRSGPGRKLVDITAHPSVAIEAEGRSGRHRWSIVVRGVASRLGSDSEIESAGIKELAPSHPGDKLNFVGVVPSSITGRSFAPMAPWERRRA
ncbi:pyridoxamine 5'-phosphate oxidase family protein [soil metagenome]